ncbi:tRNA (adenosine(37)-N6)-dimethylallyltransferase MiaA [Neptuniibacter pectenicola]|jgi:tRNA dimethylallyltransferase|uniref:tRNA (adenosine(37)-N6)-dimethylallyltransferase MiaA n=1 Tax=Neptuniibacter pectenicola TaxID=1806669 RepID=UPI00082DA0A9|nr:tRNA (adenosine(37)-N6)-dimethylallyltransferase MiaA [Neptuniibacter pectenicola]|tara:strand:+ start:4323 stop:5228 length:906 start_codon:yes stop_codon:yes gene_type:complete
MGPTASGKTDLAMQLYDQLPCEIVSVDSAMIYRGMDIGTAKPDSATLARYPHKLIDLCDPAEAYSAAEFRRDALAQIDEIRSAGKIPLLTGGTMMYFHALKNGLATLPEANPVVREQILKKAELEGWESIHRRLADVDPESAARLNKNDSQRLQRALEVYEITGRPMSELWAEQKSQQPDFSIVPMAVMPKERTMLHERIEKRFDIMLEQGFVDEVRGLWERGDLTLQMPSVRCVGYRQVWEYFAGTWDFETMKFKGVVATRQLAKRQVTWLRSWENLAWMDTHDPKLLSNALKLVDGGII